MGFLGYASLLLVLAACHREHSRGEQAAASASVIMIEPSFFACADVQACGEQCDAGSAASCRKLAASYAFGQGVGKDEARATSIYEHACEMKDLPACMFAGQMYEFGRGVEKDTTKAAWLYERACDAEGASPWAPGCYNLGIMYERGTGVPADHDKAMQLFHTACKGGALSACDKEHD